MQNKKLSLDTFSKFGLALLLAMFVLAFSFLAPVTAFAADDDYQVIIEDQADLFTDAQEAELKEQLKGILPYGSATCPWNR